MMSKRGNIVAMIGVAIGFAIFLVPLGILIVNLIELVPPTETNEKEEEMNKLIEENTQFENEEVELQQLQGTLASYHITKSEKEEESYVGS